MAQDTDDDVRGACTQSLDEARTAFDEGRIHEIPGFLEDCLGRNENAGGFTDVEKTEALRLLILTHIYLEEPEDADSRMLELLKHEHEFQVNDAIDPTEFILLYNSFRTKPIFSVGFRLGATGVLVNPTAANGTFNLNSDERGKYGLKAGFPQVGMAFEFKLNHQFTLTPELLYSLQSFDKTSILPRDGNSNITSELTIVEEQTWLTLPVGVQFFPFGEFGDDLTPGIRPFIQLGASVGYLLDAKTSPDESILNIDQRQNPQLPTIDLTPDREQINYSAFAGIGAKVKVGEGFALAQLRFHYGIPDMVKEGSFYNNPTVWELQNANDQFKQNLVTFSLGYVLHIYSPKKLDTKIR